MRIITATKYLYELQDFALADENPELLELIRKSMNIVEETMLKNLQMQTN